jgi:hypothetical protein
MVALESRLQFRQHATFASQTLNGVYTPTISLYCQCEAGSASNTFKAHGASTAHTMLAANMGARQTKLVT